MRSGITEKRLADKRFRKTEEAILQVFFEARDYLSIKALAIKVGVARSTVYHHHKAMREILPDYEKYILKKYLRMMRRMAGEEKTTIKIIYINTLVFVLRNKKVFDVFLKNGDKIIFEEMLLGIEPIVENEIGLPKNSEKLYRVLVGEIVVIIEQWGEVKFAKNNMSVVLADMLSLTETARTRLVKLLG